MGAGKGFLLGGIAGLTGGLAYEAVAGWVGGSAIANGAIGGFAGGVVGGSAQEGCLAALQPRGSGSLRTAGMRGASLPDTSVDFVFREACASAGGGGNQPYQAAHPRPRRGRSAATLDRGPAAYTASPGT